MTSQKIGPTNHYPEGSPLSPTDQGGIAMGVKVLREQRKIIMHFGATLHWMALTKDGASQAARSFRKLVFDNFGTLSYTVETLPLKVTIVQSRETVTTTLPSAVEGLEANPEVFLAWAQRLDEAVAKIVKERRYDA